MEEVLPDRVKYWLTEAQHDCFFIVGLEDEPTERIGAIKHLLMGDSLPFRAMLQDSELAEKGDIRVKDVEPGTFKNFLKCVYGASGLLIPKLTFEECAKLLYVTEKYLVSDFSKEIIKQIEKLFSVQNIYIAISHPICYQKGTLKDEILKCLKYNFDEITKDEKFLELDKASIIWILQQQSFNVKEIQIWDAILRWAKHKTNSSDGKVLRSYIIDCLKYFRFLTMEYSEFWNGVVTSKVLLEEEVNDIFRALASGNPCTVEHLCDNRRNRYNLGLVSKNIISSFTENTKCALFLCSVTSISDLKNDLQYSMTHCWAGHLWNLGVRRSKRGNKEENDALGVFLGCEGQTPNWNCSVDVEMRLINQDEKSDEIHKFTHTFSCIPKDGLYNWGFSSFIEWSVLLNPNRGFVKDNTVYLIIKIKLNTQ